MTPQEIAALCERLNAQRSLITSRPTIAELEAILAEHGQDTPPIQINPDGSVTASADNFVNPDGPAAAAMITALAGEREGLAKRVAELEAVMKMHGKRLRDERSSRWDELS